MSEFYKQIKSQILSDYKSLGYEEKISFYVWRGLMILIFMLMFSGMISENKDKYIGVSMIICLVIIIALYYLSMRESKKDRENRMRAVHKFIKREDINMNVINLLIEEIEGNNKKNKTFAVWIVGLISTFTVLLTSLFFNFIAKIFDIIFQTISKDDLIKLISEAGYNDEITSTATKSLQIGFTILGLYIIAMLIIYNLIIVINIRKKSILKFLYDARYQIIVDNNIKEKDNLKVKNERR